MITNIQPKIAISIINSDEFEAKTKAVQDAYDALQKAIKDLFEFELEVETKTEDQIESPVNQNLLQAVKDVDRIAGS